MRLGFHLSIAGSLLRAVSQAQVLGCQALQIFVQPPRGWKWRPVAPAAIRDFARARGLAELGHLLSHPWLKPEAAILETPKPHQAYEWYNLLVARSLVPGTLLLPAGEAG